jgi:hypothetical protein
LRAPAAFSRPARSTIRTSAVCNCIGAKIK